MLERSRYEMILREHMKQSEIKILTGMYRSGKSTLLKTVQRDLRKSGVKYSNILYIDFEAARHSEIRDGGSLLFVVRNLAADKGKVYLLLDEIGNLPDWEKAVLMIQEQCNCDIYLSGTRSSILDERTRELLAGHYLEIPVYPFQFLDFVHAKQERDLEQKEKKKEQKEKKEQAAYLQDFMIYGNMPGIHKMFWEEDTVFSYLLDVCQAGLLQNVVRQWKIRDISQIWMILACVAENLGKPLSAKVIAQELKEEGQSVGKDTVYTILRALTEAQILQKVSRYELRTGKILEAQEKYYFTDWGMYHSLHGTYSGHTEALLENIVCMELLARGWQVYRIQNVKQTIDFMAVKGGDRKYIQVCEKFPASKPESELKIKKEPEEKAAYEKMEKDLLRLSDSYEKIIIFLNGEEEITSAGIRKKSLLHFLLNEKG
ncbi:MAG: ATP-binding protein [Lachnospiraceae bacterium]|nr:ATP-binding protein [Lachnospiraceae bacterium]